MYLGTGWSLILFSFPGAELLTVQNYYAQFVPQVEAATHFFTWMTGFMLLSCIIMAVGEWKTWYKWCAIVTFCGVIGATALTILYIFPYNATMEGGITDATILHDVLHKWMRLNVIRVSLWTIQWTAMMIYFAAHLGDTR